MVQGRAGIERARHGDLPPVVFDEQVRPALDGLCRLGVVGDAGGDDLGAEEHPVLVVGGRIIGFHLGFRIGHQPAFGLELAEIDGVGHQEHIRLDLAGGDFRAQDVEQLAGAVAGPLDLDLGVPGLEGVHRLLGDLGRLRRVEGERFGMGGAGQKHG